MRGASAVRADTSREEGEMGREQTESQEGRTQGTEGRGGERGNGMKGRRVH